MESAPSIEASQKGVKEVLYARFGARMRALQIDYLILLASFLIASAVGAKIRASGPAAFGIFFCVFFLYDPVMVWRTGGTVGHHLQNLKIVSDRTAGNPTLLGAIFRHIVKTVFGGISFLHMMLSDQQKALHDQFARTTVQIRNRAFALHKDFVAANSSVGPSGIADGPPPRS